MKAKEYCRVVKSVYKRRISDNRMILKEIAGHPLTTISNGWRLKFENKSKN